VVSLSSYDDLYKYLSLVHDERYWDRGVHCISGGRLFCYEKIEYLETAIAGTRYPLKEKKRNKQKVSCYVARYFLLRFGVYDVGYRKPYMAMQVWRLWRCLARCRGQ
jgi:hypothetical protein